MDGSMLCRNPLHALAGAARFLLEECRPNSTMFDDVTTIVSSATQMSNLITALVDWTGVSSASSEAKLTAVGLPAICSAQVITVVRCQCVEFPHVIHP